MPLDTERIRLTRAQIELIRPGLADLVAEYHSVACTGSFRVPRLDRKGYPIQAQLPSAPQFAVITSALEKLSSLQGRAASLSVTALEVLAFILGVNLTERLLSPERSPRQIRERRQRVRHLIRQLENDRRRVLARYLEVHGPEAYSRTYQEWLATMRALRRQLLPSASALQRTGMTENARMPAGAEAACYWPEPPRTSQTAGQWSLDLSFLDDVPGATAGDRRENGGRPIVVSAKTDRDPVGAGDTHPASREPAVEKRDRAERERQTDEHGTAVAMAVIGVLEQAPDLLPGNRKSLARDLGRWLAYTEPKKCSEVFPAVDIDTVIRECKPRRAAMLDVLTTMNFYMSWLWTAMARLAPASNIRQQVAQIILGHNFVQPQVPLRKE